LEYLNLGGHGFILGDGTLNYGRENIVETYYTCTFGEGCSTRWDSASSTTPVTTVTAVQCMCPESEVISTSDRFD
jgi:hypothetical protein